MILALALLTSQVPPEMAFIPGGAFEMGSEELRDEGPVHRVEVAPFWMDRREVTTAQFAKFVQATGYVTDAERVPDQRLYPGAKPGGLVFQGQEWKYVKGASWRAPSGGSASPPDHPVTQVSWKDAATYAKWAGKRLPTEAEWEFAARAGLRETYIWGDAPYADAGNPANIWQGHFPTQNTKGDGFLLTSPVGSYPANRFGLYDMAGNVWEWCQDWYHSDGYGEHAEAGLDRDEPGVPKRVVRGGSFLCAENYCRGYRPTARMKTSPDTALFHTGFRCVKDFR